MNTVVNRVINEQCGFITEADVDGIKENYPTLEILIRTGMNRYLCGIGQIKETFELVESKGDYVRDVGLTADACKKIKKGISPRCRTSILQRYPD